MVSIMKKSKWIHGIMLFFGCVITSLFYIINSPRRFVACEGLLLLAVLGITYVLWKKGINYYGFFFLFAIAFIIRSGYIIYTPTWIRQHDVIGFGAGFGQAGYIEYFYNNWKLIDFDPRDFWGFFQPPLHHILAAIWLKINVLAGFQYNHACENIQVLTLLYGYVMTIYAYKILKEMKVEGKALLAGTALVALHPCFILMSGSINNDMLCILLQVMAVYYFLRWYKNMDFQSIVLLALCVGGSMMAKLSGVLIAPAIAVVFLLQLWKKKENFKRLFVQYIIFGIISIPIGVWSPLRNYFKFSVPLTYTPEVGEPVGTFSLIQRIFDIRTSTPFTNMIVNGNSYDEYNVPLAMLKTSLVGEYNYASHVKVTSPFAWCLLVSGAILMLVTFFLTVYYLFSKHSVLESGVKIFLGVYYVTSMAFYVNLCFNIPNFSSQDFRYIAFLIVIEAIFLSIFFQDKKDGRIFFILKKLTAICLITFCFSSTMVYLFLGLNGNH